jgi:hypothetical protein
LKSPVKEAAVGSIAGSKSRRMETAAGMAGRVIQGAEQHM